MRHLLPALSLVAVLGMAACNISSSCTLGVALKITGPANDTVAWVWLPVPPNETRCDTCKSDQIGGEVRLNSSGQATVTGAAVGSQQTGYTVNDFVKQGYGECSGTTSSSNSITGCPAPGYKVTLNCAPTAVGGAGGNASVTGQEQVITLTVRGRTETIYDHGTVSVTLDGQTIGAGYSQYSTLGSIANELAMSAASNGTISSQFAVTALQGGLTMEALNGGTQYDYPWSTSCTHAPEFSYCSFSVTLHPASSLASQ